MWKVYPMEVKNMKKDVSDKQKSMPPYLALFFIVGLFGGYDAGYVKSCKRKYRIMLKMLQFSMTAIVTLILLVPGSGNIRAYVKMLDGVEYVLVVTCFTFAKYNIYDFTRDINGIDDAIIATSENKIGALSLLILVVILTFKSILCVIYCHVYEGLSLQCPGYFASGGVTCSVALLLDGVSVTEIIINYYLYRALKYLKIQLKERRDLNVIIMHYLEIADYYDQIMPMYGILVIGELLSCIPKSMMMLVNMIISIKKYGDWSTTAGQLVFIVHIMLEFCGPAISVQRINSEVKAIKLELCNQLMQEQDAEKKQDLFRLARYLESRQLEYRLLRIIPVDLRLVVTITNITTAYFIVVLQFTHLL